VISVQPPPLTTRQPPAPTAAAVRSSALGLFPRGDLEAVRSAGFATPEAAADAYLIDRTRPETLPDGYSATHLIYDGAVPDGDTRAIVGFKLQTDADSGDGLLLAERVSGAGEAQRWVVLYGGVKSLDITELEYRDGRLSGSFTSKIGGRIHVSVYDAVSGDQLAPVATSDVAPARNDQDARSRPAVGSIEFDGLSADAVAVRLWNTNDQPGGHKVALFAEALVHDGELVTDIGENRLADRYY
jgi:hypothetical protein